MFALLVLNYPGCVLASPPAPPEVHPVTVQGYGFRPPAGMVPNAAVALAIARNILIPIYGQEALQSQEPLTARLVGQIWVVEGHLPIGTDGGEVDIRISKVDACIKYLEFGK